MLAVGSSAEADFWRWVPHPEVWVLVGGLVGLYVYAARVIGPKAVRPGQPVLTPLNKACFVAGILLLWVATDWPVHDIGEQYLYLVHMSQHLVLTLVVPPLMLLATPEWLARLVLGRGRVDRWVHKLARPVPAAALFNGLVLLTHWQVVVNRSSEHALFHYGMHTALVHGRVPAVDAGVRPAAASCASRCRRRCSTCSSTSIIPTVPGAWLTFAEGAVYKVYDIPDRLWGISVTSDQQVAGLIMKLGGGTYLWVIIAGIFFTWASRHDDADRRGLTASERDVLTWDRVQAEFEATPAPVEPAP